MRSFVYHQVQAWMQPEPGKAEEAGKLRAERAALERLAQQPQNAFLRPMVEQKRAELAALTGSSRDDADTVGAVTGQIAGAIWGYQAIPSSWRERLARGDKIVERARQLMT